MAGRSGRDHPMQYLFMTETIFFFLIVMCAIMGFTLLLFVAYHFYLISQGNTTNERVKKNDDADYYTKELKYCQKLKTQFNDQVREIDWKGEKVTMKDLELYGEECRRKKAISEVVVDKSGFFSKLLAVARA